MLLHELVTTTDVVASTASRLAKVDALATLLKQLEPEEIAPAIGFLLAKPRQGRNGVGWRGLAALEVSHAAEPGLTVREVDAALERLAAASGAGSVGSWRAEPCSRRGSSAWRRCSSRWWPTRGRRPSCSCPSASRGRRCCAPSPAASATA